MYKDMEVAQGVLQRQVDDGAEYYFDFVEHRLKEALEKVETAKTIFLKTQDYHAIQNLVIELSNLNLGFERAVKLTNKIAIVQEDIAILEETIANDDEGC